MKIRGILAGLIAGICILVASAVQTQAQGCPAGWSTVTSFGQFHGGQGCVIKITYCINNSNPSQIQILSWVSAGGTCAAVDMCEAVRQTVAFWEFGSCENIPQPPPRNFTISFCDKTCSYLVQCGPGEYPIVTNQGCF